jgi:hypothetical protein
MCFINPMEQQMETLQAPALPKIGEAFHGGLCAGITTGADGAPYALVLLMDKPATRLSWSKAMDWAKKLDADLPNRTEGAMLFALLKAEFDPEWHWLNEQRSGSVAWFQNFVDGTTYSIDKTYQGRARAVRRLPINPSILSVGEQA